MICIRRMLALPLLCVALASMPAAVSAQDAFTWTGGAGTTDWQDPLNWLSATAPGAVPGEGDDAQFGIDSTASGGGGFAPLQ